MPTKFAVQPIDATFGAVITDVKLATIDEATLADLKKAWLEYGLLVFPGQFLTNDEQIAFAKRISPLEFEMSAISNVKPDGTLRLEKDNDDRMKTLKGNMGWHMDSTYMPVQARGAVFSAEEVPTIGGHTGFCDMRAAYDALDAATKAKVEKLQAYHSLHYSQAKAGHDSKKKPDGEYSGYGFHDGPVPLRPLVKVHSETGRKNLVIGRHAHNIPGMDKGESERFLQELADFATTGDPRRVYHHDWKPGDVVLWDNRRLMHRATPWDFTQRRIMWHSRLAGDPASETALNYEGREAAAN
jgi:alpha-ketoglutarate-dependent taurine dioxygenase